MASSATTEHLRRVGSIQLKAILAGRHAWTKVKQANITRSWIDQLSQLAPAITALQLDAAETGAGYVAGALAEQGHWAAPTGFVNTAALAGAAPDGRSLDGLLYSPAANALALIGDGMAVNQALKLAGGHLDRILTSTIADTSRQAASIGIATRDGIGFLRHVNPPCCSRCAILAGRFYRWNDGFLRHPRCDCVHVPTTASNLQAARDEGLVLDPYEYFNSLTEAEQNRVFTRSGAQAIRDGADMFRVVNARRGMSANGMFTTEGMGKRGFARQMLKERQRRMTPELIYRLHPDPADARAALAAHGYIHPGGQNPLGSIKGAFYEGYGELGRGGTRVAARRAIDAARTTGMRDPSSRYTMTAAERRVYDARLQWKAVQEGRNPFGGGPLTPKIAAAVEDNYRRQIANAGQKYLRSDDALTQAEKIVARAGGAGGAGTRPPRTTSPGPAENEWAARQAALGLKVPDGRQLPLDEILVYEHLQRATPRIPLAAQIEILPLGKITANGRLPSHDFLWLARENLLVEVKRVKRAEYGVIKKRINDAINDAWRNHRFDKDVFLIDIGNHELRPRLRRSLEQYNQLTQGRKIQRLFVLCRNQITEIKLLKTQGTG